MHNQVCYIVRHTPTDHERNHLDRAGHARGLSRAHMLAAIEAADFAHARPRAGRIHVRQVVEVAP